MNQQFSFYLQKNNSLFNGNVLSICYYASDEEVLNYGLTSNNILIFIKDISLSEIPIKNNINYIQYLQNKLINKKIFLRIQCECLLGIFGDSHCDCEKQRIEMINFISKNSGIFIYLPQEAQGWGLNYKLKELELQVSGRNQKGDFIGIKNRDDAQKILLKTSNFKDKRSYEIIYNILNKLGFLKFQYILLSENNNKLLELEKFGLNIEGYDEYRKHDINVDNMSEYLIKILNETHKYSQDTLDQILTKISNRQYNARTLATLVKIVKKIENDKEYNLDDLSKEKILKVYNDIICGDEKQYFVGTANNVKIQNNFCCRVSAEIFKTIKDTYNQNVFDRISLEKLYYFQNKKTSEIVKIRISRVLDVRDENAIFFVGQQHGELRVCDKKANTIVQNDVTVSKLNSYFENPEYDYTKRVETVTTISEGDLNIKIFIKRIPTIDNYILDVFGKKENIKNFLNRIMLNNKNVLLDSITNPEYEDENFTKYNLRFANLNSIIDEELEIFHLLKGEK